MEEKGPSACPHVIQLWPGYSGRALPNVAAATGEGSAPHVSVWRAVVGRVGEQRGP